MIALRSRCFLAMGWTPTSSNQGNGQGTPIGRGWAPPPGSGPTGLARGSRLLFYPRITMCAGYTAGCGGVTPAACSKGTSVWPNWLSFSGPRARDRRFAHAGGSLVQPARHGLHVFGRYAGEEIQPSQVPELSTRPFHRARSMPHPDGGDCVAAHSLFPADASD